LEPQTDPIAVVATLRAVPDFSEFDGGTHADLHDCSGKYGGGRQQAEAVSRHIDDLHFLTLEG
jgi:hypothetical protein